MTDVSDPNAIAQAYQDLMSKFDVLKNKISHNITPTNPDLLTDRNVVDDLVQYAKLVTTKVPKKYWSNVVFCLARGLNRLHDNSYIFPIGADLEIVAYMSNAQSPKKYEPLTKEITSLGVSPEEASRFALAYVTGMSVAFPLDISKQILFNIETNPTVAKNIINKFKTRQHEFGTESLFPEMTLEEFKKRLINVHDKKWLEQVAIKIPIYCDTNMTIETPSNILLSAADLMQGKAVLPPLCEDVGKLGMCAEKHCIKFLQ